MNRKKIKEDSRKILKTELQNIIMALLIVNIIIFIADYSLAYFITNDGVQTLVSNIISIASLPMQIGMISYTLKLVRNEKYSLKEIIKFYPLFIYIFSLFFFMWIFSFLWALLFIIPGIIAAISYNFAPYVFVDGDTNPISCIKKSKQMIYGYKWDYFVFILSFLGWIILSILTFGILFIYVIPYISVANVQYYEELRKVNKID